MPLKNTVIGLNLISSDVLMHELMNRFEQIIIIRENRKDDEIVDIKVKTAKGKFTMSNDEFDIVFAQELLLTAQANLLKVYLEAKKGSDDAPDAREGP